MDQTIKGKLITLEGPDGSGKTTQIKKLSRYLKKKGYPVLETQEPGHNTIGRPLRSLILDPAKKIFPEAEIFLYLADRAQHTREIIKPALLKGKIVISDRFADATLAYQGYGRKLNIKFVKTMNKFATENIVPDLTFLLDIEPKAGKKRTSQRKTTPYKNGDRLEQEKIEFHEKLRQGYLTIAKAEPKRFKIINAKKNIAEIFERIRKEVEKIL